MSYTVYDSRTLIVDSWPNKDASRRLLAYSRDIGRILVQAQAVRKLDSKLAAAVQQYCESQLELVYGKSGWRLVGAHPYTNFHLATAVANRKAVRRIVGLFAQLVTEQRPDKDLYHLIINSLTALCSAKESEVELVETLSVLRLLAHLGYAPDPSAANLSEFIQSQSYQASQLSDFRAVRKQAVQQINQSLQSIQL